VPLQSDQAGRYGHCFTTGLSFNILNVVLIKSAQSLLEEEPVDEEEEEEEAELI